MMTLIFFYGKGRGEEEEEEVDRTIGTIGTKEAKRNNYRQIAEKVSSRDQTRLATAYIHRDRKRERLPQHQTKDDKKREKKRTGEIISILSALLFPSFLQKMTSKENK
jgi:hypothetical protein